MSQNTFYSLLRIYVRFWHNVIFYRKVEVKNFPSDLPANTPLLIVTNHQNTLMDALAVVLNVGKRQPYFLTRADLFKKDVVRKLLMSLKMLPVYRLRDGLDEMQQNDEIFSDLCPTTGQWWHIWQLFLRAIMAYNTICGLSELARLLFVPKPNMIGKPTSIFFPAAFIIRIAKDG
ncbi:MAG: 1-acyl-sn-glycerol-3-phosphate acyltransferase [Spirosomataceae bacterium]